MKRSSETETEPRKRLHTFCGNELPRTINLLIEGSVLALETGNVRSAEKQLVRVLVMGDSASYGPRSVAGDCLLFASHKLVEEGKAPLADDLMTTTTIVASENGFYDTLRSILEYQGANPRVGFHYPLRVACEKGFTNVVSVLLNDERVDPNAAGGRSPSRPIVLAAEKGHVDIVRQLLSLPKTQPDVNESEALRLASKHGHAAVVDILLQDGRCDPNACNSYSLIWACNNGHADVVRALLDDSRTDPGVADNRAIIHASCNGHVGVARHLINDPRVSPEAQNNSSLVFASFRGHTDIVKELLNSERVDPTAQGNMSLIMACVSGHVEVVEVLLNDGRINPACSIQRSGMLNQELVRVLDGCRVKVGERIGNIPLLAACEGGHSKIVKLFLNDGRVDPSTRNNLAIKLASKVGDLDIVNMLLCDSRVDSMVAGRLAIKKAHSYGYQNIVTHLLFDPRVNPSLGVTILTLALKRAILADRSEEK